MQPLQALREGHWFKLICGASFQHLPSVRNLVFAYSLAGVDCIDVAADPAVVTAAQSAVADAHQFMATGGELATTLSAPLLMVSINDGEDPHFRKAVFDPERCPADCPRPCQTICPAEAIAFNQDPTGVIAERCYGCGRCLPVCPIQQITTQAHGAAFETLIPLLAKGDVQALEIHTQVGRLHHFEALWRQVQPHIQMLKVLAISCPEGQGLIDYLRSLHQIIVPLPCSLIWQTDGRPMSGDIGDGATRATVKLAEKVLHTDLPGYIQLAGGTNRHTIAKLKTKGLLNPRLLKTGATSRSLTQPRYISGVAYGSYARKLFAPVQADIEASPDGHHLEQYPALLSTAVASALAIVTQLKPVQSEREQLLNHLLDKPLNQNIPQLPS